MSNSYRYNINNNIDINDLYLIGNPQITYFKSVYRKHVNFEKVIFTDDSITSVRRPMPTTPACDFLSNVSVLLKYHINNGDDTVSNVPTQIINFIEYSIGIKKIEKLTGEYIEYYNQLRLPLTLNSEYSSSGDVVIGNSFNIMSHTGGVFTNSAIDFDFECILPIPFSFSTNIGNSLPLLLIDKKNYPEFALNTQQSTQITLSEKPKIIYEGYSIIEQSEKNRFNNGGPSEYIYTKVYKHDISDQHTDFNIDSGYGNIKSFIWNSTIEYTYNITVNDMNIFTNSDGLESTYFTRYFPMRAGLLGTGRDPHSSNNYIIANNNIHYYTFGLKDNKIDGEYTPNGTVDADKNDIKIISDFFSVVSDSKRVYIITNNIISFNKDLAPQYIYNQRPFS
jgi:hypothetical protein